MSRRNPWRCRTSRSRASAVYSGDDSQEGLGPPARTDNYAATLGVVQPIFTWGQIGAALRLADIGRSTAGDRMAGARGTALRDAAIAFYDVLLAREFVGARDAEPRPAGAPSRRDPAPVRRGHGDRVRYSRGDRRRAERPSGTDPHRKPAERCARAPGVRAGDAGARGRRHRVAGRHRATGARPRDGLSDRDDQPARTGRVAQEPRHVRGDGPHHPGGEQAAPGFRRRRRLARPRDGRQDRATATPGTPGCD